MKSLTYKPLSAFADLLNGYAFKSKNYVDKGIRVIRISNVQDGYISDESPCFYPEETKEDISKYILHENDFLVSLTGNVGRVAILNADFLPAALNQRVSCIRIKDKNLLPKFLFYYLLRRQFQQDCINVSKGVAQLNLSTKWLEQYPIPVMDIKEQEHIVGKIEELFSELDSNIETLKITKQQLAVYRQAVLKQAFVGCEAWDKCYFSDLMSEVRNGYGKKPDDSGKYRIIKISAVRSLKLDLSESRLNETKFSTEDTIVENDILFTRYNGSKEYVGVCVSVPALDEPYAYPDKIIKCSPKLQNAVHSKYLTFYMSQGNARTYLRSRIKTTSGQNGIAGADIKKTVVYIPSMDVQAKIVAEIEMKISVCDDIEKTVDTAFQQAEALRQSILKKAFEGVL